ncbi:signal peptidase II [Nocardioides pacificus]
MQAARGTPLSSSGSTGPVHPRPPARRRIQAVFAVVALVAYGVDVVSKVVAVERLTGRPDVELVGSWFRLHLIRNPGAAFSAGTEYTVILSCIAIAAACVVLVLSRRLGSLLWSVGLGLLLAGILGNLTDRLLRAPGPLRGHVIDFFRLPNWPIFNFADIFINVAAGVIILQAIRGIRLDGGRISDDDDEAGVASTPDAGPDQPAPGEEQQ